MEKIDELITTQDIVLDVLKTEPITRNSDMALYVKVCERINPEILKQPFWYALVSLKQYNLPCIETVRRTRQKIQANYPELCGKTAVENQRMVNEEVFRGYSRGAV